MFTRFENCCRILLAVSKAVATMIDSRRSSRTAQFRDVDPGWNPVCYPRSREIQSKLSFAPGEVPAETECPVSGGSLKACLLSRLRLSDRQGCRAVALPTVMAS